MPDILITEFMDEAAVDALRARFDVEYVGERWRVEIEEGRVRRIEPLEANRATPGGACLKGLSYTERVESSERILYPMARRGARRGARARARGDHPRRFCNRRRGRRNR